ncbi:hypothetical protein BP5796_04428 [Coleophoma crateriformis]|uniref:Uncharacterized protein n=1 Tax=Coleophoma crateriformis TaxID=565419 RepID=A0A3D8S9A4_9HELO|nr:hypothetical protein BP5796_04428 [Coleophoma crateriformis]
MSQLPKNMIRQSMFYNREYYYPHRDESVLVPHLEHCIDNLRESLMCEGDMTFYPMLWAENMGRVIPDFEVVHTCRDYSALKEWADNRDAATEGVWQKSAARLHATMEH